MRRTLLLVPALALASVIPSSPARAAVPVVVAEGRGWGHGVGMAQDGAFWMGAHGATHDEILDHFYPGTGRGSVKATVRVVVHVATGPSVALEFPDGGELRSPRSGPQHAGFPVRVAPGGTAVVSHDGSYGVTTGGTVAAAQMGGVTTVELPTASTTSTSSTTALLPIAPPSTTTTAPSTTTTAAPGGQPGGQSGTGVRSPEPVWAGPVTAGASIGVPARGLRYRGELEVSVATGPLRVVDEVDLEQYLWGLGEVSASWSPASLRAQVIAARTYAARAMAANGEICDTQRCQVYRGRTGEFAGQVDAVNATLGTVLTFGGGYASAVFSANAAGISATPSEGFGTLDASHPYLQARPYDTGSSDPWEARIALADLGTRVGYPGTATSVRVASTGPSGRPVTVELDGDAGRLAVGALDVDAAMGMRSTMWSLRIETADVAPPAPEARSLIQAQPDAVGTIIAEETARALVRPVRTDAVTAGRRTSSAPGDGGGGSTPVWPFLVAIVGAGIVGLATLRRSQRP